MPRGHYRTEHTRRMYIRLGDAEHPINDPFELIHAQGLLRAQGLPAAPVWERQWSAQDGREVETATDILIFPPGACTLPDGVDLAPPTKGKAKAPGPGGRR